MIFSSNFDHCRVNPFICVNFWRQACIPSPPFRTELMSFTPSLPQKLERCQRYFLKNVFFVPNYSPSILLLKLFGLHLIESEAHIKRLLLLGLITEPKIAPAVKTLCDSRVNSYFNPFINAMDFFVQINESLCKYNLNTYFKDWHANSIFPSYNDWRTLYTKRFLNTKTIVLIFVAKIII